VSAILLSSRFVSYALYFVGRPGRQGRDLRKAILFLTSRYVENAGFCGGND
jgi:hypothetical protein